MYINGIEDKSPSLSSSNTLMAGGLSCANSLAASFNYIRVCRKSTFLGQIQLQATASSDTNCCGAFWKSSEGNETFFNDSRTILVRFFDYTMRKITSMQTDSAGTQ